MQKQQNSQKKAVLRFSEFALIVVFDGIRDELTVRL
jgi:hypothetical protein